ncbi:hypothetical protein SAMN05216266_119123 [Amycolatopsis marina]|uniref:Uncharacterized protein n=1 Tax=Amycolatopsis marina TaxID=490629 RepID=A0A1I1C152_9PSEU|nr:hypothetical protein SAMN05216266_119123 [Amycolatopsis marina]
MSGVVTGPQGAPYVSEAVTTNAGFLKRMLQ